MVWVKIPEMHANSLYHSKLIGHGRSRGHHGEIFQGVVQQGCEKHLQPVLVSLPCAAYYSSARYLPLSHALQISPDNKVKALRAAQLTLELLEVAELGGELMIESNIPVGRGLGSSSADVVASIRAVADAFGKTLSPPTIAQLAVRAETAVDPLMFEGKCVLFAQRAGRVIDRYSSALPPLDVLSLQQISAGAGIDTLALSIPAYTEQDIKAFAVLLQRLRAGILKRDLEQIAAVASASAHINQRFLKKPHLEEIECIGRRCGALGIQIAHSGSTIGLIFKKGERVGVLAAQRELSNSCITDLYSVAIVTGMRWT